METKELKEIATFKTNELTNILNLIPYGTSITITVTQSLASLMLERGIHNRTLRKSSVKAYLADMLNNEWEMTGESIKFNKKGELIDGFHRLTAFKQSGLDSIDLSICTNVSDTAFAKLDSGVKRTPGDIIVLRNGKNHLMTAAAIKIYFTLTEGRFGDVGSTSRIITNKELDIFYVKNCDEVVDIITKAQRAYKQSGKIFAPGIFGGLLMFLSKIDQTDAEFFIDKLGNGIDLQYDSPILALRNRFIRLRSSRIKVNQSEILKLAIVAWNKFRENKKCTVLQVPKDCKDLKAI